VQKNKETIIDLRASPIINSSIFTDRRKTIGEIANRNG
jgi:hypothetical protein